MQNMIMGGETEYGLFVEQGDRSLARDPRALGDVAHRIVNQAKDFGLCGFVRSSTGIRDFEEHLRAERRLDLGEVSRGAFEQRHGRTGHVLLSGARWYVDMEHPEYSTAEVTNPRDMVIAQKAGDRIADMCAKNVPGFRIRVDKNNSDGNGHSYAAHENYSLSPKTWERIITRRIVEEWCPNHRRMEPAGISEKGELADFVTLFFVTRQIVIGSGKVGAEIDRNSSYAHTQRTLAEDAKVSYQISQRADFFTSEIGEGTLFERPIINTRDMPYADSSIVRRLHVIVGDGNMSELSIHLRFGITALFLMMLEEGVMEKADGNVGLALQDPVDSLYAVSRDLTLRKKLRFQNGAQASALEVQQDFCDLAGSFVVRQNLPPPWHDVVEKWGLVLEGLEGDRGRHPWAGNLDWVIKERVLLSEKRKGADPLGQSCRAFALGYHNIDPEHSIYTRLVNGGHIMRLVDDGEIEHAMHNPPTDTRAWLRSKILQRFGSEVTDMGWDYVRFENSVISMDDPRLGGKEEMEWAFHDNPSFEQFAERMGARARHPRSLGLYYDE